MAQPRIDSYSFGHVVIDGVEYESDVIVLPDRVLPNWWRVEGHVLAFEDLQQALAKPAQTLVVGTGRYNRMSVPHDVRRSVQSAGVEMIVLPTHEACESYNTLREQVRVAAALHLAC